MAVAGMKPVPFMMDGIVLAAGLSMLWNATQSP
jgi:hypothetical protein